MGERKQVIGVCASCIFDQIPLQFSNLLQEKAKERDYSIVVFSAYRSQMDGVQESAGEGALYELARHVELCAIVILTETIRDKQLVKKIVQIGKDKKIPVFSIDGEVEGCYNMPMNYLTGFEQIVRHVIEAHGCRRINMLAGFRGNEYSENRVAVYRKVLQEYEIPVEEDRIAYGDFWDRPAREAVNRFLDSDMPLPEAIVCANDAMAVTTCTVLNERGIQVPKDMIVTGFDGIQCGQMYAPTISTCEPDYNSGVRFILDEISAYRQSKKVEPKDFTINFVLSLQQSCGCRPKSWKNINKTISKLAADVSDCNWHNIAMNNMVSQVLDNQSVMDIARVLPEYMNLWTRGFRFACVKSELISGYVIPDTYHSMTTILQELDGDFKEPGETFEITEKFIPQIDEILDNESTGVLVVRLLSSGTKVYGYVAEGMDRLDDRSLQRNNEFSMFLSHSINTILHNMELRELNNHLSQAYGQIAALYVQDSMTGVLNRRGFYQALGDKIHQAENQGRFLHVYSIDMDGLKRINDTYGHSEGDFAINTMAHAIVSVGGENALCARFGGDEFVCAVISDMENESDADTFRRKLSCYIETVPEIKEKPYEIGASVGVCCERIFCRTQAEHMISRADKLMYQNKVQRKKQRVE